MWSKFSDPEFTTPALDRTIEWVRKQITNEAVARRTYLRVRDLAKGIKLAEQYQHLSKVTSKLIHPTAWSVLSMREEGELLFLKPIFFHAGVRHGIEMAHHIHQHLEEFGPEPKR